MTVTSVTVKHDGWSASVTPGTSKVLTVKGIATIGAKVDFTVVFTVETDDRLDGPQIVGAGDVAGVKIPSIGDFYEFGNDKDKGALCKSINVRATGGKLWDVTCVYGPKGDQKPKDNQPEENPPMRDPNGDPTDDPMLAAPTVQVSLVHMKQPLAEAIYGGQYWATHDDITYKPNVSLTMPTGVAGGSHISALFGKDATGAKWIDNRNPVVNSAGTPYDPPLERDHARINLRITRNHQTFPINDVWWYQDTINTSDVKVLAHGFEMIIPPHWAKMMSISGTPAEINGQHFYRVTYEMHIEPGFFVEEDHPWRPKVLDRGLMRRSRAEEDSDKDPYDQDKDDPGKENIKDSTGQAVMEPVLLNGAGNTLVSDPLGRVAVWLEYAMYKEIDWEDLKFDFMGGIVFDNPPKGIN